MLTNGVSSEPPVGIAQISIRPHAHLSLLPGKKVNFDPLLVYCWSTHSDAGLTFQTIQYSGDQLLSDQFSDCATDATWHLINCFF